MVYSTNDVGPNGAGHLHVFGIGSAAGENAWSQRFANELETSLNEQPIIGTYTNPVSLYQRTRMLGTVTLDSTLAPSLYIGHGTEVRIDGSTSSPPSLRAFGSVRIKGSTEAPVLLRTVPSASSSATWRGLYVHNRVATTSDPDTISHAQVSDALIGVEALSPVVVRNSSVENTFNAGVWSENWLDLRDCSLVDGTGDGVYLGPSAATFSIQHCTITNCASIGINSYPSGSVTIDSTSVTNADVGIKARHGTVTVSASDVRNCSSYGLYVGKTAGFSATGSVFSGNDTGAHVAYEVNASFYNCSFRHNVDGFSIISGDTTLVDVTHCTADSNTTTGLYIGQNYAVTPGSVTFTRNTVAHSAVGIYAYGAAPEIRSRNVIQHNSTGIKCDNNTYAAVESCTVTDNSYGVYVVGGNLDLGHVSGGSSTGCNILKPNSTKYVKNTTTNTISAQQNYWPQTDTCQPRLSFISGSFDVSDALCDPPGLSSMAYAHTSQKRDLPRTFALGQNYPNPFNPTTSVAFDVPSTSRVRIAIYDVVGRLVTVLIDGQKPAGRYQLTWNGHDRRGQSVATGVYFLKMQAGRFVATRKLVLLK